MEHTIKQNASGQAWLLQAATGLLLVLLLGLHLIANHFVVQGGLQDYRDVVNYLTNPAILVLEVLFLVVVTTHALLGIRSVVFDLGLTRQTENAVTLFLTILGIVIVAYAVWLSLTLIHH